MIPRCLVLSCISYGLIFSGVAAENAGYYRRTKSQEWSLVLVPVFF